jgi:hypothetical protein
VYVCDLHPLPVARRRPSASVLARDEVRVGLPVFSFVQMLDDPTPFDSYRLQWDPRFVGDFIVALSLSDPLGDPFRPSPRVRKSDTDFITMRL